MPERSSGVGLLLRTGGPALGLLALTGAALFALRDGGAGTLWAPTLGLVATGAWLVISLRGIDARIDAAHAALQEGPVHGAQKPTVGLDALLEDIWEIREAARRAHAVFDDGRETLTPRCLEIGPGASELASGAVELMEQADRMRDQARSLGQGTRGVVGTLADAGENVQRAVEGAATVTRSLRDATGSAVELDSSIGSVHIAIEEMSRSLLEVSHGCGRSTSVAQQATQLARETRTSVRELGQAAKDIGQVLSVITDIADQTKLLALNATIEAANAGEAGRGFAVVASEVKELARQTASATDEIRGRIEAIRSSTEAAVEAIERISGTIEAMGESTHTIAAAVEEQTATCSDIGRNVTSVTQRADGISSAVQRATSSADDVARHVTELAGSAGASTVEAERVTRYAAELQASADKLVDAMGDSEARAHNLSRICQEMLMNLARLTQQVEEERKGKALH
jgi:methyl-accepting chemotaxis protein